MAKFYNGKSLADLGHRQPAQGHVIACRMTAECPETGFKPGGGRLHQLKPPACPGVWAYFSLGSGGAVHEFADSQFGHVFARGVDREEARLRMLGALKDLRIEAEFRTTTGYLQGLLGEEAFRQSRFSTAWLDGLIQRRFTPPLSVSEAAIVLAGAVVMGLGRWDEQWQAAKALLQRRQYPPRSLLELTHRHQFLHGDGLYSVQTAMAGCNQVLVTCNDSSCLVTVRRQADGALLLQTAQQTWLVTHQREAATGLRICINGQQALLGEPQDPTRLRSPSPGKLVRYLVGEGERVAAGQPVAEVEVMKMCLTICSQAAGTIRLQRSAGAVIASGELIARLEGGEVKPKVCQPSCFRFEERGEGEEETGLLKPHQVLLRLEGRLEALLAGWVEPNYERIIPNYLVALRVKTVPFFLMAEAVEQLGLAPEREAAIKALLQRVRREGPTADLLREMKELMPGEWQAGREWELSRIAALVDRFLAVESCFSGQPSVDGVLAGLRQLGLSEEQQLAFILAHERLEARSAMLLKLLERFLQGRPEASRHSIMQQTLKRLGQLNSGGKMARRAREMLLGSQLPSLAEQRQQMMERLRTALNLDSPSLRQAYLSELIQGHTAHLDALPQLLLLHRSDPELARLALEIYIRRLFEPYYQFRLLPLAEGEGEEGGMPTCCWSFSDAPNPADPQGWVNIVGDAVGQQRVLSPMPTAESSANPHPSALSERAGLFTVIDSLEQFRGALEALIEGLGVLASFHRNVLYLAMPHPDDLTDDQIIAQVAKQLPGPALDACHTRRVTLMTVRAHMTAPGFYTFRGSGGWQEDCTVRHIEPALAHLLAFPRMIVHHDISFCHADPTGQIHIYRAKPRGGGDSKGNPDDR